MKWRGTFLDKYAAVTTRSVETIADKKLLFICFVQFISAFQRVMPAVDRFDEGASFLFFVSRTYPGDKKGKASRSVKFTTQTHTHIHIHAHQQSGCNRKQCSGAFWKGKVCCHRAGGKDKALVLSC